jgi:hypothetical protein
MLFCTLVLFLIRARYDSKQLTPHLILGASLILNGGETFKPASTPEEEN